MKTSEREEFISGIKQRHEDLSRRSRQASEVPGILPDVEKFIAEIRQAGQNFPPGSQRDLLRSLATFWGSFVYQQSDLGIYPNTELDPYLGGAEEEPALPQPPPPTPARPLLSHGYAIPAITGGIVLVFLILGVFFVLNLLSPSPTPTAAANNEMEQTEAAISRRETALARTQSVSLQPSATPVPTRTSIAPGSSKTPVSSKTPDQGTATSGTPDPRTATLAAMLTQAASNTTPVPPTITPPLMAAPISAIVASVNNLVEGQEVAPSQPLVVQYANLQPGWSIHLLLQAIGQNSRYYPQPNYYMVPENATSGEWVANASFNPSIASQFNITPVIAMNDKARQALIDSIQSGFTQLPDGVVPLPQVVNVRLGASDRIQGVRMVYSSYEPNQQRLEIASARTDGTDARFITSSPNVYKLFPALSPSGRQIVFVGREFSQVGEVLESLMIVDSSGQNASTLLQEAGYRYERPTWSQDGKTIVYSAQLQGRENASGWEIYLYDLDTKTTQKIQGLPEDSRYPAWTADGKSLIFSGKSPTGESAGIYRWSMETGQVELLIDTPADESMPAVSMQGDKIAFISYALSSDNSPLYSLSTYDLNSKAIKLLMTDATPLQFPQFDPSGWILYYEAPGKTTYTIWALNLLEGRHFQVTNGPFDRWPSVGKMDTYLPSKNP